MYGKQIKELMEERERLEKTLEQAEEQLQSKSDDPEARHELYAHRNAARSAVYAYKDSAGDAYGTTVYGGNGLCQNGEQSGCGTIFQVDAAGKEKILYNFAGMTDEGFPQGGLALDAAGNLYGTTTSGYFSTGYGTAFKLSPQGKLTLLHNFTDSTDGGFPFGTVAWDSTGHLYGTTGNGGDPSFGCGVVFEVTP